MLIGDRTQENPEPGNVYRVRPKLAGFELRGEDG